MTNPLRVLMLEDNPADAELVLRALRRSGYNPIDERVDNEKDYRAHLRSAPEVILADFSMPGFSALRALEIMHESRLDIPFIIVSGTIGEELAVEVMRRGATDYIMKDRLARLGQAVALGVKRKLGEEALRKSERQVRELTAHIDQVLWMMDAKDSKVLYVSPGYEKMLGRSSQNLLDNPASFMEGIHPLDEEMMRRENAVMLETGHIDVECRVLRPDGVMAWLWIRGYPVTEQGRIVRIAGVIEDVTEKRRLLAERETLVTRLHLYIERMPLAYILFDAYSRIIDWNPTAERIFGYTRKEMLGTRPPYEKYVPQSHREKDEELRGRIRSGDMEAHSVNENLTKDGRTITCQWFNTPLMDDRGRFVGFLALAQDVTEQKSLQAQIQQAQKMDAFGQLASGVAHDFNNLLTIILGYCEILISALKSSDPMVDSVNAISEAGERAASLTRQLLAFSRKTVLEPKVLDLNNVVRDSEKLLRRLIREDIALTAVLDPAISRVKIDPGLLGQVLMNLAVNARDAMPHGGKLTIETSDIQLDQAYAARHPECRPGRYVKLVISDNGCGMTPEVKSHIFEPFFTTKEPGKGTGLGLATVYGIVKQSGGNIDLYSEPGHGTTFKIYLPAVDARVDPLALDEHAAKVAGGAETILLVEDDDAVRAIAVLALQIQGYVVLQAESGKKALEVFEKHDGRIDMIVTDVVMPGMSGRALAEILLLQHPGLKVLYMSGYTDDSVIRHGLLQVDVAFLQKPYTPLALSRKVREELDKQAPLETPLDSAVTYGLASAPTEKWTAAQRSKMKHEELEQAVGQRTEALHHTATHDRLTGLSNRALLIDRLTQTVLRQPAGEFGLLFLDFDRFKVINDSLGHDAGDQLLKGIAERLLAALGELPEVAGEGSPHLAARLGGDEFVILLEGSNAITEAQALAERLLVSLRRPYQIDSHEIYSTASIGITTSAAGYTQPDDALRDADLAMYRAKSAGKDRYVVFDRSMHDEERLRLAMEIDLRQALDMGEIHVQYQPIINIHTGRVQGFEALTRWRHPTRGDVSPREFIPIAEETGLITVLGRFVLLNACQQLSQWRSEFSNAAALYVSVNLSHHQLFDPDLFDQITDVLKETGLAPSGLKLELTEKSIMEKPDALVPLFEKLKTLGVGVFMDDFGTRQSALMFLQEFPPAAIKINRDLLFSLDVQANNAVKIQTIVRLAQNLKVRVIAQGIETPEQLAQVQIFDWGTAQGFHFSKPLDAKGCLSLLSHDQLRHPQEFPPPWSARVA